MNIIGEGCDSDSAITEQEAEIYDRQIRLWGLDAQNRLRNSAVLLIGLSGVGVEVLKNLMLTGVKKLVVLDSNNVSDLDRDWLYLAQGNIVGINRAQACLGRCQRLNPMVEIVADTRHISELPDDYWKGFDLVCGTGEMSFDELVMLNEKCRKSDVKFCCGFAWGVVGFAFVDFGEVHDYVIEAAAQPSGNIDLIGQSKEPFLKKAKLDDVQPADEKQTIMVRQSEHFTALDCSLFDDLVGKPGLKRLPAAFYIIRELFEFHKATGRCISKGDTQHLISMLEKSLALCNLTIPKLRLPDQFAGDCYGQLISTCAIVGGVLTQEIIKCLSSKDKPINNYFFYDGFEATGTVMKLSAASE